MAFFDSTPLGRIINRFSKDLYTIDVTLPQTMNMYITNLFSVIATFAVIIVATPWFIAMCVPLLALYIYVQNYYIPSSRQLQRVDSVLRSPIFAHFSETLDGVATIRAYRAQKRFKWINTDNVDSQQRAYYLLIASNRWLAVRLEFVGTMVVVLSSLLAVIGGLRNSISPGVGGLAILYALNITQSLNWMVRMTRLVLEQTKTYPERDRVIGRDNHGKRSYHLIQKSYSASLCSSTHRVLMRFSSLWFTVIAKVILSLSKESKSIQSGFQKKQQLLLKDIDRPLLGRKMGKLFLMVINFVIDLLYHLS